MTTIRAGQPGDADDLGAIAAQTFALACPANTPQVELQKYIDENLRPANFDALLANPACDIDVAEDDGKVIGFSLVSRAAETLGIQAADGIPELTRCYVLPAYHGTGLSQRLLMTALSRVSGPIRLMVNDQNEKARRFYARNGFAEVGATSFQCGDDIHRDLVLVRPATPD